jgi:hypothetical protein
LRIIHFEIGPTPIHHAHFICARRGSAPARIRGLPIMNRKAADVTLMTVRLGPAEKEWLDEQVKKLRSSQSSEITRLIVAEREMAEVR